MNHADQHERLRLLARERNMKPEELLKMVLDQIDNSPEQYTFSDSDIKEIQDGVRELDQGKNYSNSQVTSELNKKKSEWVRNRKSQ